MNPTLIGGLHTMRFTFRNSSYHEGTIVVYRKNYNTNSLHHETAMYVITGLKIPKTRDLIDVIRLDDDYHIIRVHTDSIRNADTTISFDVDKVRAILEENGFLNREQLIQENVKAKHKNHKKQ